MAKLPMLCCCRRGLDHSLIRSQQPKNGARDPAERLEVAPFDSVEMVHGLLRDTASGGPTGVQPNSRIRRCVCQKRAFSCPRAL